MGQLMYGKNVTKQILKNPERVQCVYLVHHQPEIETLCQNAKVSIEWIDKKHLDRLTHSTQHQGVAVEIEDYKLYSLEELMENRHGEFGFLIMLDELEDPHNLGAVLRTADAVQADGVIFKKNRSVGLTPTVAKVSAGAIDTVKCCEVTNLTTTAQKLKEAGYWIVGADMNGQDYRQLEYDFPTVLVIGNEGHGISQLLRKQCDYVMSLPMEGEIESLNASVSAGILMYSVYSKRHPL